MLEVQVAPAEIDINQTELALLYQIEQRPHLPSQINV